MSGMAHVTSQWADYPFMMIVTPGFKKDLSNPTIKVATEMALAHNSFFRGLNSIYLQAPHVTNPSDIADFLIYCQAWFEMVTHHHDMEEEKFFPAIARYTGDENVMCENIEGHKLFHEGLERFGKYIYGNMGEGGFDAEVLKGMIDGFKEPFERHMREEIDSLLGLEKFGGEQLLKAYNEMEASIIATSDKYRLFPLTLGARDVTYENGMHTWPPIPFFVPYIVHYYFERRYAGAWRFSPSDTWGRPRKLQFLGH